MSYSCTQERFLSDIENHTMEIKKDDGLYRHLRFSNNGSNIYRFDLVTWPGVLCIEGDCGSFIFSRLPDMFNFFGGYEGDEIKINPSYWGEKLISISDKHHIKKFDREKFEKVIWDNFNDHEWESDEEGDISKNIVKETLKEDLENKEFGFRSAHDYLYYFDKEGFTFIDSFEFDITQYTFHYIWNLYAIVWGIQTYYNKIYHQEKENTFYK